MIYLDNAATTFPKPECVYKAVEQCMREYAANPGRSGHKLSLRAGRAIHETRELIAELINADDPMQVIFTSNATEAINLALKGALKSGDHVLASSMEHNSVLRPIHALSKKGVGFSIIQCGKDGTIDPADIEAAITSDTRMIAMTHASNVTGTLFPIEEIGKICKRHNLLFLLDASQSAGTYDLDVRGIGCDLLAAPGHKGLMGPQGTGFLYIKKGLELETLIEGGTGSKSEETWQPMLMPDRYESGTLNTPGIIGLGEGIRFIKGESLSMIRSHEQRLAQYMIDEMKQIQGVTLYGPCDSHKQAAVVAFNIKDRDSSETAYLLDDRYDICARSGLHCAPLAHKSVGSFETGAVRLSIGYFNSEDDITKTIEAVRALSPE